jgi:amicyanin
MKNRILTRKVALLTLLSPLMAAGTALAAATDLSSQVSVAGFAFNPDTVEVSPGQTVRWVNNDAAPHTTTSREGRWDSGTLQTGQTYRLTFNSPGTYEYICTIHPSMSGKVVVRGQ